MPQLVSMGAQLTCCCGAAPSVLMVAVPMVTGEVKPVANIMDNIPMTNIMPFGVCQILTASAAGVFLTQAQTRAMAADFDWMKYKGSKLKLLLNKHPYADAMIANIQAF